MAGFAERFINAYEAGNKSGTQRRVDDTIQKFGTLASQGDEQAMGQIYGVDPGAAAQLETQFSNRNKSGAEWDQYVQEQAGRVAHSVLTAPAEQRAQRVASGIDFMTGLTRRDPRFKTVIDGWRQKLQAGDMPGIESELNAVLERTMGFKDRLAGNSQPKSETERMWAIINGGDPSSPEYRMAYHELFGKEKVVVDPQSGMPIARTSPPPAGVTAPGGRPQAPGPQLSPPVSRPAAPAQMPPRPSAGAAPGYAAPGSFPDPQLPPAEGPPVFQDSPAPPAGLPMVDAFGRPIDPMAETAAERRDESKQQRLAYTKGQEENRKAMAQANTTRSDTQRFMQLNEKVNKPGSGSVGTGGPMAIPFASAVVGAFDSDIGEMNAIAAKMIPAQREPGSGSTSDFDASMFKQGLFGPDKNYGTNKALAQAVMAHTQNVTDYGQFYDAFYKKTGSTVGIDSAWQTYLETNPIFDPSSPDDPKLNAKRENWRTFFTRQGTIGPQSSAPAPAPGVPVKTKPTAKTSTEMDALIKSNPGRFVPLD
jgi:hypothetical protein